MTEKADRDSATTGSPDMGLPGGHRVVLDRVLVVCQADERGISVLAPEAVLAALDNHSSDMRPVIP